MARKSRYIVEQKKEVVFKWNAAVYIRLSKEDKRLKDINSVSVGNQKRIAEHFLEKHPEINVVDYFIDDGWSGTDLDRPQFQRLQRMYESGQINCIIIKDLSRLARNYEESSKLVYIIFPFFKIRFISINDNVDTYERPDSVHNLDVKFKNMMNDEYSRDNSKKVIAASRIRRKKGLFLGAFAPYGYLKDPLNHNKLIVDRNVAGVVRFIFDEFIRTRNFSHIAKTLTARGVLPPRAYKKEMGYKYWNPHGTIRMEWSATTVRNILESDVYIGNLTQNKRKTVSYKDHRIIKSDKEYWITVENTHEPIISLEVFMKVQEILREITKEKAPVRSKSMYAGHIYCGFCGRALNVHRSTTNKDYRAYFCNGKYNGANCSFGKSINQTNLDKVVLSTLNCYLKLYLDLDRAIEKTNKMLRMGNSVKSRKESLEEELKSLSSKKGNLYISYKEEIISQEEYLRERKWVEDRISDVASRLERAKNENESYTEYNKESNNFLKAFSKYKKFKKLTPEIIRQFVDKINVYSPTEIEIHLRFDNEIQGILSFLKEHDCDVIPQLELA